MASAAADVTWGTGVQTKVRHYRKAY